MRATRRFDWLLADLKYIPDQDAVKRIKMLIWNKAQGKGVGWDKIKKMFYKEVPK